MPFFRAEAFKGVGAALCPLPGTQRVLGDVEGVAIGATVMEIVSIAPLRMIRG